MYALGIDLGTTYTAAASVGSASVGPVAAVPPVADPPRFTAGSASVGQPASPGQASASSAVAKAAAAAPVSPSDPTQLFASGPASLLPPPVAPVAPGRSGSTRLILIAAGAVLLAILAGTGIGLALTDNSTPVGNPTPAGTSGSAASPSATKPALPADEQCTDAIKSNKRWVCLTKATITDGQIRVEYEFEDAGVPFNKSNGFHLHIYGANANGSNPADNRMGAQSGNPGNWYIEDQMPSIHEAGSSQYNALDGYPKVCARIANSSHHLVADDADKFKTGNCVPLTKG